MPKLQERSFERSGSMPALQNQAASTVWALPVPGMPEYNPHQSMDVPSLRLPAFKNRFSGQSTDRLPYQRYLVCVVCIYRMALLSGVIQRHFWLDLYNPSPKKVLILKNRQNLRKNRLFPKDFYVKLQLYL